MRIYSLILLMILSALLVVGCSDSLEPECCVPSPPAVPYPFASSEAILMQNFLNAYEDMDYGLLNDFLHTDFATHLQDATLRDYPGVGVTLNRADELIIGRRMFAGDPVTDTNGELVPGISSIKFELFQQLTAWSEVSSTDVVPNGWSSAYLVTILFNRGAESTLKTEGIIKFYAVEQDSIHNGESQKYWKMIGQLDQTIAKNISNTAWGSMKLLFR